VRSRLRETPREGELDAFEYLYDSPYIPTSEELAAYAMPSFVPGRPLLAAVLDLTRRIFEEFEFDSTATTVATPPGEVLKIKRGVCQDFAHLEVGCLRSIGLSARYVSGYLETEPPPGKPKLAGADVSHAWISVFCPGIGWVDVDPTNNILASEHHITIGWGRDYGDVSPIRGVLLGGGTHSLSVGVDVVRIEIETPLMAAEIPVGELTTPPQSQSQSQSQIQA
jgi:transglutaminase-like putative cysteine protease